MNEEDIDPIYKFYELSKDRQRLIYAGLLHKKPSVRWTSALLFRRLVHNYDWDELRKIVLMEVEIESKAHAFSLREEEGLQPLRIVEEE